MNDLQAFVFHLLFIISQAHGGFGIWGRGMLAPITLNRAEGESLLRGSNDMYLEEYTNSSL